MRVILSLLILIISLQSWTKADDISEFEIEGMSIGDSLLNYFTKNHIENSSYPIVRGGKKYNEYKKVQLKNQSTNYDYVLLYYKTDDPDFIIKAIAGRIHYENNIDECYEIQKKIVKDLELIFSEDTKDDKGKIKNIAFPDGNSYKNDVSFYFDDGMAHTACYDYSIKDTKTKDRLSVGIYAKEYLDWFISLKKL